MGRASPRAVQNSIANNFHPVAWFVIKLNVALSCDSPYSRGAHGLINCNGFWTFAASTKLPLNLTFPSRSSFGFSTVNIGVSPGCLTEPENDHWSPVTSRKGAALVGVRSVANPLLTAGNASFAGGRLVESA